MELRLQIVLPDLLRTVGGATKEKDKVAIGVSRGAKNGRERFGELSVGKTVGNGGENVQITCSTSRSNSGVSDGHHQKVGWLCQGLECTTGGFSVPLFPVFVFSLPCCLIVYWYFGYVCCAFLK